MHPPSEESRIEPSPGPRAEGAEGTLAGPWVPGHAPPASADPRWPTRRIFGAAFTAGTAVVLAYVLLVPSVASPVSSS